MPLNYYWGFQSMPLNYYWGFQIIPYKGVNGGGKLIKKSLKSVCVHCLLIFLRLNSNLCPIYSLYQFISCQMVMHGCLGSPIWISNCLIICTIAYIYVRWWCMDVWFHLFEFQIVYNCLYYSIYFWLIMFHSFKSTIFLLLSIFFCILKGGVRIRSSLTLSSSLLHSKNYEVSAAINSWHIFMP